MESVASSVELMNEMDDMIFDLMNNTVEEERVWVYPGEAHGIAKETTLHWRGLGINDVHRQVEQVDTRIYPHKLLSAENSV